jgi:hypothetical protein
MRIYDEGKENSDLGALSRPPHSYTKKWIFECRQFIRMYVYMYVRMYVCMYVQYVCVCMYVLRMYVCIYVCAAR